MIANCFLRFPLFCLVLFINIIFYHDHPLIKRAKMYHQESFVIWYELRRTVFLPNVLKKTKKHNLM